MADLALITVRSNLPPEERYEYDARGEASKKVTGGKPIALWERDPARPGGEVLVVGDQAVRVARTERVVEKLRNKELVQVANPELPDQGGGRGLGPAAPR